MKSSVKTILFVGALGLGCLLGVGAPRAEAQYYSRAYVGPYGGRAYVGPYGGRTYVSPVYRY